MIDVERIVEQLRVASMDSPDIAVLKIKYILKETLLKQCNEDLNVIFKYRNQWEKTKAISLHGVEDNDPTSRLIRLLFNSIIDDINDTTKELEKV